MRADSFALASLPQSWPLTPFACVCLCSPFLVFAPNLIRPRIETPQSMLSEMPSSISVIASFIAHHQEIFQQS